MRTFAVILLLSSSLLAKEVNLADFPIDGVIRSSDYTTYRDRLCYMGVEANGTNYVIHGIGEHCTTFSPGSQIKARIYTKWGIHFFDIAWIDKNGKIKQCGYVISEAYK